MQTPHERLRHARKAAGYRSARSAAQAMGVAVATYVQHENGSRMFTAAVQDRYHAFFAGAASPDDSTQPLPNRPEV